MTSDVVLTAALRNNLLSLQNTQRSIDTTQFRLATGRKVNSALDNPQSFFAAQALNNRASDLTRLLDSIGQSIQVIKAADNGVTALTQLIEQADSIAQSARDALAQGQQEAKVIGDRDLRGIDDLTDLAGVTDAGTDTIILQVTDSTGAAVNIGNYGGAVAAQVTLTIATNTSTQEFIDMINNIEFTDNAAAPLALGGQVFEASLDDAGRLQVKTLDGNDFRVQFQTVANTDTSNLALAADLGFGSIARLVADDTGAANNNVEFTAIASTALTSFAFYDNSVPASREIADASDTLNNLTDSTGATSYFANLDNAADDFQIGVNGGTMVNIDLTNAANTAVTIQDFIDDINNNVSLNTLIRAAYDTTTGQVTISAIDASVKSVEIGVAGSVQTANWGFGRNPALTGAAGVDEAESIQLAAAASQLAQFEDDYNALRDQIDLLVEDTSYRGTNLLNGDDLLTYFNEDRTTSLTTQGATFTASGLNISAADFSRTDTVDAALDEIRSALEAVRDFGSSLASDLSVIQARQSFTEELINTLTTGADALTIADQNEEGAKLLALQTRQQLGVTSLSLASQSNQSILRLF